MKNRLNFLKKFKLRQSYFPRFHEECGVFGISGTKDAAASFDPLIPKTPHSS